MSTAKILCGALAGVAAGMAIGLLTAPDSGEETRRKIRRSAHHLQGRVKKILGKGADGLTELKYIFEHEVTGLKDDVRTRILTLLDESIETFNSFKKEAKESV
ncbi:YtxH domain-containing protein [Chitinophaga rhizophila]|uniref:YtxH domain-containing protein n=1 Tax=Chitinophaga rhizophila TaxID=2866212 RepID=A0ABS7GB64_9BACT|nr:YtxH domain-containing protein [Chitinophaga rhizophila]MBW8684910.1 YtxH domain-containing protein [Chitinophaga rhizophila]